MREEILYEDEKVYVYAYTHSGRPSFLVEGRIMGTLDNAGELLQKLYELCMDQQINSDFEYYEGSEDGEVLSDEFYIPRIIYS